MKSETNYTQEAQHALRLADHMLTVTYPLVKDQKMLLGVLKGLQQAHSYAVRAVFENINQLGEVMTTSFPVLVGRLKKKFKEAANIEKSEYDYLDKIFDLNKKFEDSPVVFAREKKYVICEDDYALHSLRFSEMKKHLEQSKKIVAKLLMVKTHA